MVNFNARFSLGWLPIMLHQIIGEGAGLWCGDDVVFCIHAQKGVRTSIVECKIAKDITAWDGPTMLVFRNVVAVITNKDRPLTGYMSGYIYPFNCLMSKQNKIKRLMNF
jgi:hypothetical protein